MNTLIKNLANQKVYDTIIALIYDESRRYQEKNNGNFRNTLTHVLGGFGEMVSTSIQDPLFCLEVEANIFKVEQIVNTCYMGKRSTAYIQLKNLMKRFENDNITVEVPADKMFYRM